MLATVGLHFLQPLALSIKAGRSVTPEGRDSSVVTFSVWLELHDFHSRRDDFSLKADSPFLVATTRWISPERHSKSDCKDIEILRTKPTGALMYAFTQIVDPAIYATIAMSLSNVILGSTWIWPTWIKVLFVLVCLGVLAVVAAFIFMILFLLKEYFSKRKK